MNKKKYLIIGSIVIILLVIGCIGDNATKQFKSDDEKFVFSITSLQEIGADISLLGDAIGQEDYKSMREFGRMLGEDTLKNLKETESLKVSEKYQPALEEYRNALRDFQSAAEIFETGTTDYYKLMSAKSYLDKGSEHLDYVSYYMDGK